MPAISKKRWEVRHSLAYRLSDMLSVGSMTGTVGTTSLESRNLTPQDANLLVGSELTIYSGAPLGESRIITSASVYTAPGSMGRVWFKEALPSSPSAAGFEVHRKHRAAQYNEAINAALRGAQRSHTFSKRDFSNILGARLRNGTFHLWANGTSSAPDSWTLYGTGGAVARESSLIYQGLYSARITADVMTTTGLRQSIPDYMRFSGKTVSIYAKVFCATADQVRLVLTDGVTTWNSDYHNGNGINDMKLESKTLASAITALTISVEILGGAGSISAYALKFWDSLGADLYEYPIPSGYRWIRRLWQEGDVDNTFVPIPDDWWYVMNEGIGTTRQLRFHEPVFSPTNGKVLMIEGNAYPTEPTDDSDTIDIDPEYVVLQAGADLLMSVDRPGEQAMASRWRDAALRLGQKSQVRMPPNAKRVEDM